MAIIESTSGQGIIGHAEKIELDFKSSIAQVKSQSGRRSAQRRGPLLYTISVEVGSCKLGSDKYHSIMDEILDLEYGTNTLSFALDKEIETGMSVTSARGVWDTKQPAGFQYNNEDDPDKLTAGTPDLDQQIFLGAKTVGQRGQTVVLKGAWAGDYTSSLGNFTPVFPPNTSDGRDISTQPTTLIGRKGDYIQFDGSTKVHQITSDVTAIKNGGVSEKCTDSSGNTVNAYSGDITVELNTPLVASPDVDVVFADVNRGVRIGNEVKFNMSLMSRPSISYLPGEIVQFGQFVFEEVVTGDPMIYTGPSELAKIVCTAMNEQYGFGSFRNTIWLQYSEEHMTPYHEKGYHMIFKPWVDAMYKDTWYSPFLTKWGEGIARRRSADIFAEMKGKKKRNIRARIERAILEPLCYVVGRWFGN
jgi:hypothetical protein